MTLFPRHHDRSLWQPSFKCAPPEKPARCFEDTRAGWCALIAIFIVGIVICAIRFAIVCKTGTAP